MENLLTYFAFFLTGTVFGSWLPMGKFVSFSLIVTIIYFVFLAFASQHLGMAVWKSGSSFICIQLGYVTGVTVATLFREILQKGAGNLQSKKLDAKNKPYK